MKTADNYTIVAKEVKHARLRVSEDGNIRIIVPQSFNENDLENLLEKKKKWIQKNKEFFKGKSKIALFDNQLLLFGNRYNYFYETKYRQKVVIDDENKNIKSQKDLMDISIQVKWYKKIAKEYLNARTKELALELNFKYNKIYIRNQRTKLGNCSNDKNISYNWRLIKAPEFVIDYLIIHELVHTKIMDHTSKFWTLLKSLYPDYKAAINWLDKYGNSL